jgi:cell division protein FtsB
MISIRIAGGWLYAMRRVLATVCIGVLAVFLGYKVIFGANGMKIWQAKRAEYDKLRVQIDEETDKHEQLRRHVDALQREDPSAIEKEAREQLGYVRPGETVLYEQRAKPVPKPELAVVEKEAQK